jgi:hypothetical protein
MILNKTDMSTEFTELPNTKYDDSSFSSSQGATVTNAILGPCIANTRVLKIWNNKCYEVYNRHNDI